MKRIEENREKMIELGLIKPKVKVVKSKKNKVVDSIAVRQSERINKKQYISLNQNTVMCVV